MEPQAREDLRHELLEALAARHPAALTWAQARRHTQREFDQPLTQEDVESALQFLKGLGCVESAVDELGVTIYWRATSAGVLAWERGAK